LVEPLEWINVPETAEHIEFHYQGAVHADKQTRHQMTKANRHAELVKATKIKLAIVQQEAEEREADELEILKQQHDVDKLTKELQGKSSDNAEKLLQLREQQASLQQLLNEKDKIRVEAERRLTMLTESNICRQEYKQKLKQKRKQVHEK
jgi:hypothetical protein